MKRSVARNLALHPYQIASATIAVNHNASCGTTGVNNGSHAHVVVIVVVAVSIIGFVANALFAAEIEAGAFDFRFGRPRETGPSASIALSYVANR